MQLLGAVQLDNAETAVAAALQLREDGFPHMTDEAIATGLAEATLPGRFQVLISALKPVLWRERSSLPAKDAFQSAKKRRTVLRLHLQ